MDKKSTYESLLEKYGCKIIPLDQLSLYTGCKTPKAAQEKAVNLSLPFPAFKSGGKNGTWLVNIEHLAKYLDDQDREYTKKYEYKHE